MKNFQQIMGVINLTPDSFSDGGEFNAPDPAIRRIREMIVQGADIVDIGGESTGPGSSNVSVKEELARVRPVIDTIVEKNLTDKTLFSIDTYKTSVAEYALKHGFQMVNDVTALRGDQDMIGILLKYKPYIVLVYSKDPTPRTTKEVVEYDDVIASIKSFLMERISVLVEAGFPEKKIIIDPGMGAFISSIPDYSFEVINRLKELRLLGFPILVGISRKSCLGGRMADRDQPSVDWSLKALQNGASVIRIHNVALMKKALQK
ncbi:MAG: dihydropteroate synthase [Patescibacteria group bacterium]